ncbi:MAG: hypothetical protein ACRYE8_00565 [Janthinobacterium lividum]
MLDHGEHCPRGSFLPVTPWLVHGVQLKNTNNISIFYYFLDAVVKPRHDTEYAFRSTRVMPPRGDSDIWKISFLLTL